MSEKVKFRNSDRIVEFYEDKIDLQILNETYTAVSSQLKFGNILWPRHLPGDSKSQDLISKIEDRLAKNNNEYSRFSNDYLHCHLSYDVFKQNLKKGDVLKFDNNWKVIEIFSFPHDVSNSKKGFSYFSALYYNEYKGQAVLAHRGIQSNVTDFFKKESSFHDNLSGILLHEYIPQLVKCYEVTERCYQIAKDLRCTLSFTGFSNGAWLSENCIYFCEKYIKADYVFDFEDFFEVQTKAVLFESPGIFRTKNEYQSNIISNEYEFDTKSLNIVNYLLSPNLMNSTNYHVGIVYRLFLDERDQIDLKKRENLEKFIKIPLIGKKITEYSVEVRYLFNGLNSMFNCDVLKKVLDTCFDPKTECAKNYCQMISWPLIKIDFYKNIKENLKDVVEDSFENLFEMIPFVDQINIVSKPIQFVAKKIIAMLTRSLMEGFAPATHILICVMIEFFKGNLDLKFCNNSLFYCKIEEFDQIVVNNDYIKKKYSNSKDSSSTNDLEKKIEKKFSLFYNSNYVPVRRKKVESQLLNISDDYSRNIDWILYHLKQGQYFKNIKSKIVRNQLAYLKEVYDIDKVYVKEQVLYIIRIRKDKEITFENLKEKILRLLSVSKEDIREIIFRSNSITNLNFVPNLGLRKAYVKRKNIIDNLHQFFYDKNVIYLYGRPGTGKSFIAKEFGFRFLNGGRVRFFESEDKFQFLNSYHRFLLNFLDEYTTEFSSIDYEKLNEIAIYKLLQQQSQILFIFDNVEVFDVIESVVSNYLLNEKVKILITTRNKELNPKFDRIEVNFFDQKEALEFVKLNNEENLLNQKVTNLIISKLGVKNEKNETEILPKTLEINVRYLLENYITESLKTLLAKDDFQIFEYIFRSLDPDQIEMLKYFSFLNPKRINVLIIKDICKRSSNITDCIMKLKNIGIIDVHKEERCLSMHRLIRNEIKKIFETAKEKKQYLSKLVKFILKNLEENMSSDDGNLYDEFLEHLYEIVHENLNDIYDILKTINMVLKKESQEKNFVMLILRISDEIHSILSKTSKIEPRYLAQAISNIGICYFYLGHLKESMNFLTKALRNEIESIQQVQSLFFLGKCYFNLKNFEKALDSFQKAYDMHKRLLNSKIEDPAIFFDYLINIAICNFNLNKLEETIKIYLEIDKNFNTNSLNEMYKYMNNLAFCYLKLNKVDEALRYYKKSFMCLREKKDENHDSELAKLANGIGFCLSKKEDYENALKYYTKAYNYRSEVVNKDCESDAKIETSSYLNNMGICYLKLDKFKEALDCCEKALELRRMGSANEDADLVISLKNLALCHCKNEKESEADKYYKESEFMSRRSSKS